MLDYLPMAYPFALEKEIINYSSPSSFLKDTTVGVSTNNGSSLQSLHLDDISVQISTDAMTQLKSLTPLLSENESFIAGGSILSMISNRTPRDIDIYFYSFNAYIKTLDKFLKSKRYVLTYTNDNCVGFKNTNNNMTIELIHKEFGPPECIISNFDFTVTRVALTVNPRQPMIMMSSLLLDDIATKKLDLGVGEGVVIKNPDMMFNRLVKYVSYGYTPSLTLKKLLFASIQGNKLLDLNNLAPSNITKY